MLTVVKRDPNKKKVHWLCNCDCGGTKSVDAYSLTHGLTRSCGCYQKQIAKETHMKDLTGQKFGRLLVVERCEVGNTNGIYWRCVCDCGNENIIVSSKSLLSGHKRSCGCLQEETHKRDKPERIIDLTGKKFGRLTVIGIDTKVNREYKWLCECECTPNRIISVIGSNLRSGHTKSCGCLNSKGEELISQILHNYNIKFKTQYTFDDLLNDSGNLMRFDFGVLDEHDNLLYLIEFDGSHHFKCRDSGWNTSENLKKVKHNDKLKDTYCKKNNIILIRIPYLDIQNITIDTLIPQNYQEILLKGA